MAPRTTLVFVAFYICTIEMKLSHLLLALWMVIVTARSNSLSRGGQIRPSRSQRPPPRTADVRISIKMTRLVNVFDESLTTACAMPLDKRSQTGFQLPFDTGSSRVYVLTTETRMD